MGNNGPHRRKEELESIMEKIELLDHSIRIAMVVDNRQGDPLVQYWLRTLQEISDRVRGLTDDVR